MQELLFVCRKITTFAAAKCEKRRRRSGNIAKIAQLVEHDLAKVGVAGSSPVFRSKHKITLFLLIPIELKFLFHHP